MTIIFFIFLTIPASAEIIFLKDGQVIKAKILERGHYYIKIMEGHTPRQYYMEQIEKIMDEEDPYKWDPNNIDANGFEGIPPTKVLLIIEHMEANGARYNIQRNMELVYANTAPAHQEKLKELLVITDVIRAIIPVYASVYSEEELKEMNNFLKSPVGVKMIQATPDIMNGTAEVMGEYFKSKLGSKSDS